MAARTFGIGLLIITVMLPAAVHCQGCCRGYKSQKRATYSYTSLSSACALESFILYAGCEWVISASPGSVVEAYISSEAVDVDDTFSCLFYIVTLYDGADSSSPQLVKACNGDHSAYRRYCSTGPYMTVSLHVPDFVQMMGGVSRRLDVYFRELPSSQVSRCFWPPNFTVPTANHKDHTTTTTTTTTPASESAEDGDGYAMSDLLIGVTVVGVVLLCTIILGIFTKILTKYRYRRTTRASSRYYGANNVSAESSSVFAISNPAASAGGGSSTSSSSDSASAGGTQTSGSRNQYRHPRRSSAAAWWRNLLDFRDEDMGHGHGRGSLLRHAYGGGGGECANPSGLDFPLRPPAYSDPPPPYSADAAEPADGRCGQLMVTTGGGGSENSVPAEAPPPYSAAVSLTLSATGSPCAPGQTTSSVGEL